ncbi:MAG: amidohydrolase, partial [Myxococcota bacterium]
MRTLTLFLLLPMVSCAGSQSAAPSQTQSASVGIAAGTARTTPAPAKTEAQTNGEDKEWDIDNPPGDWGWRAVNIDTTTGTWISLDVSPDGKTLIFDLLGDIYVMPFSGGEAKPLIQGIAWHMQPRFSPDGSKIAFTSDRGAGDNIWVMNADGSDPRQVTKEKFRLVNNPTWEPSGQYIAAKKHFTGKRSLGAGEMWLYHISGGDGVQMTQRPTEQKDVNDPAFSPDGSVLYYDRDATSGRSFEYNKDSSSQIYVIEGLDRRTGEISTLTGGPGGAARPTPSPDGTKLAFTRRVDYVTTLFIRDLESGEETPVYSGLERDNQEI